MSRPLWASESFTVPWGQQLSAEDSTEEPGPAALGVLLSITDRKGWGWSGCTERSDWRAAAGSGRGAVEGPRPQRSPAAWQGQGGSNQNLRLGAGGATKPPAGVGTARAPRHLLELKLCLPRLPGVLGARQAGVPQSQGQACPFQPQLHGAWGAPGRNPEGQCEGLPIAEPLVSQELL